MGVIVHERTNRKVINPIPAKFVKAMIGDSVYLINLTDQSWVFHRTYGCYLIKGIADGQAFTSMKIQGRLEHIDQGDEKYTQQITDASEIAADLAGQANDGILVPEGIESFMGVFVSPTEEPSAKLLAAMTEKLMAFWVAQVQLGDQFWDDPKDHKNISSLMRRAAKATRQTRPWTYEVKSMTTCPACSSSIPHGLAICKDCGALLDEEKARKYFPQYFEQSSEENVPRARLHGPVHAAPHRRTKPETTPQP